MLPAISGEVGFEHVGFRYRHRRLGVLHDITFLCRPVRFVGIVGASGSGKSTLAKLIQRLYVPESRPGTDRRQRSW